MKYKICDYNNPIDCVQLNDAEMQVLINGGIFDDCPDEADNPTYDENDESIIGIFSSTNVPIVTHRLKYYIKKNNILNKDILNMFNWIKAKNSPIIIHEIDM